MLDSYLKLVLAHSTFKHSDFPKPTSKQVTSTESTAENVEETREKYPSGKSSSLFEQPQLPADESLFDSSSSEENIHLNVHACAEKRRRRSCFNPPAVTSAFWSTGCCIVTSFFVGEFFKTWSSVSGGSRLMLGNL